MIGSTQESPSDEKIAAAIDSCMKSIAATRALHTLLLEFKKQAPPPFYTESHYTKGELDELGLFQRRHLLRRIGEEAAKAGISI